MLVQVKAMRKVDHYELTQYNIDVLEDDRGSAVCSEERPYPIYPSKGGLPPTFISTAIARFVLVVSDVFIFLTKLFSTNILNSLESKQKVEHMLLLINEMSY